MNCNDATDAMSVPGATSSSARKPTLRQNPVLEGSSPVEIGLLIQRLPAKDKHSSAIASKLGTLSGLRIGSDFTGILHTCAIGSFLPFNILKKDIIDIG
jgi:hypothetical protein